MKQMFWGLLNTFVGVFTFLVAVAFFYTAFQGRYYEDWFNRVCALVSVLVFTYIATDAFWRAGYEGVYKTRKTSDRENVWS